MNVHPALLKKRFCALLLDYLVILLYGLCLAGLSVLFYNFIFGKIPDLINIIGPFGTQLIGFVTLTLPVALYFFISESRPKHASIGKRIMHIRVSSTAAKKITKRQILARTIVKFLPWEIAHTFVHQVVYYSQNNGTPPIWVMLGLTTANLLPIIYLGFIVLRKDHRGPHDIAARTIVTAIK